MMTTFFFHYRFSYCLGIERTNFNIQRTTQYIVLISARREKQWRKFRAQLFLRTFDNAHINYCVTQSFALRHLSSADNRLSFHHVFLRTFLTIHFPHFPHCATSRTNQYSHNSKLLGSGCLIVFAIFISFSILNFFSEKATGVERSINARETEYGGILKTGRVCK